MNNFFDESQVNADLRECSMDHLQYIKSFYVAPSSALVSKCATVDESILGDETKVLLHISV